MIPRLALLIAAAPAAVHCGPLADAFEPGIRGISWQSCEPETALPQGRWESGAGFRVYIARDDKPVVGVKRNRRSEIHVACDSQSAKVASVSFTFPGDDATFAALIQALTEHFGPYQDERHNAVTDNATPFVGLNFLWKDGDFTVTLARFVAGTSPTTSLTAVRASPSEPVDRSTLGLE